MFIEPPLKYKKSDFLIKTGLLSQKRYDQMIKRYTSFDKNVLFEDIRKRLIINNSKKIILRLVQSNQVSNIKNLIISNTSELNEFIKDIDNIFFKYQEVWMIVIEQKIHYMGRIILDFSTDERTIEISRGINAKVLNNASENTPYVRYQSRGFLSSLNLIESRNVDSDIYKASDIIIRLLYAYKSIFDDLGKILQFYNVDYICLQFRLEDDCTLSIYDWDGQYDRIINIIDSINQIIREQ